jgi:hypothetical protein
MTSETHGQTAPDIDVSLLASSTVLDGQGSPRRLGDFWRDKPVALVFLRHFG